MNRVSRCLSLGSSIPGSWTVYLHVIIHFKSVFCSLLGKERENKGGNKETHMCGRAHEHRHTKFCVLSCGHSGIATRKDTGQVQESKIIIMVLGGIACPARLQGKASARASKPTRQELVANFIGVSAGQARQGWVTKYWLIISLYIE